jgi:tetratricopeptide (TPR) repeat protein
MHFDVLQVRIPHYSVSRMEEPTMRHSRILALCFAVLCALPSIAHAQGAGIEWEIWEILNQEVLELYRAGKYDRGVLVAQKALEVAEQNVGPDHPDVATSLNNLALLYDTQGDYAKAEPLYKRSLAISEKALGPDHPAVATSLENLAALYRATKRNAEAEALEKRAAQIRAIKR